MSDIIGIILVMAFQIWVIWKAFLYGRELVSKEWNRSDKLFMGYLILRLLEENSGTKLKPDEIKAQLKYATVGFVNASIDEYILFLNVFTSEGLITCTEKQLFEIASTGKERLQARMEDSVISIT